MSTYSEVLKKAMEAARSDRPSIVLAFDKLSQANSTLVKLFDAERDAHRISRELIVTIDNINIVGKSISRLKDDKYYAVVVAFNPNEEQLSRLNSLNIGKLFTVKNN